MARGHRTLLVALGACLVVLNLISNGSQSSYGSQPVLGQAQLRTRANTVSSGYAAMHAIPASNAKKAPRGTMCRSSVEDFGPPPAAPQRRVVITGLGAVTPLADNLKDSWEKILAGETGVKRLEDVKFDVLPTKVAAYVKDFDGSKVIPKKDLKQMAPFIQYSMVAAKEALDDADWHPESEEDRQATGVSIGSGIGGIEEITDNHSEFLDPARGYRKISPRFIPKMLINLANGFVSMAHGLEGPNIASVTACATGSHSIGDAFRLIKFGEADVMVAGGSEASVEPLSMAGFNRMNALVTAFNDDPEKASRPFDAKRAGFVMGEGAGVMILEELEHAKARGAKIYAEIRGCGSTGDAFHVSAPSGVGALRAMQAALAQGGIKAEDIDYINAHGTSTPVGDAKEAETIVKLMGGPENEKKPYVTSTKGATGHMLGAAGAVEAIFTALAIKEGVIPPTLNLEEPCVTEGITHVAGKAEKKEIKCALSNSFGFGGTNACLLLTAPPA
uniref:beta-ketoacyl-[acyl-carrier-protein] synthase I n=1 Tax=Lotharella globosa TaxID=91324 RepID=A0A6V3RPI2_9EUKA|eukprot:CAMPEP_0167791240 /NCGR_PEP_ID=MMETSP0111_2-20121227/11814_1 /TAXON_ID=91324 /ORGANISM="Lotharella globosa, Strain CCCM811" /LENGTH=502 /DNA_ID=CAMNT_0007683863 /DNA_START=30 /DNA_END=1538 /DNA_ORIENTATION=+